MMNTVITLRRLGRDDTWSTVVQRWTLNPVWRMLLILWQNHSLSPLVMRAPFTPKDVDIGGC
ncbi:hypothetical protein [Cycloclasticus sp.]|uniref:hypothetical protein n=1 Tax=Cycloclasticus sp. TaxID=2024830 RepID=UPI00257C8975|nr:hypothetical protein [Cycloclasticus sp.]